MEFHRAEAVDRALEVLAKFEDRAQLLAGGTVVMRQLSRGELEPAALIHIGALRPELSGVARAEAGVELGALTTLWELREDPLIESEYRSIGQAAASVGSWQTQSVATIGGNVCAAAPGADLVPPLLVHGATVTLKSARRGERCLALSEFLRAPGQTAREPDELVTSFSLDPAPDASADVYLKVGRRGAMESAIVGLAARLCFDRGGTEIVNARLATCAAGPIPARAREAERRLVGPLDPSPFPPRLAAAGEALANEATPVDDARASASYRRALAPRLLHQAVRACRAALSGRE